MRFLPVALALLALHPFQSTAAQGPSQEYAACERNLPELAGHWDHTQCTADEVERQKALLNIEYKALLRQTDPRDKEALERAQKAWLTFRDAECKAKSDSIDRAGGNGGWDASMTCMLRHLLSRRDQLKGYWGL